MHIDFAKESYQQHIETEERNAKMDRCEPNLKNAAHRFLQFVSSHIEFLNFAEQVGDEKTKSIVETMRKSGGYKRITDKQRWAVAECLINYCDGNVESLIEQVFENK